MADKEEKYSVITLNNESFKQFLLLRYGESFEINGLDNSKQLARESLLARLWNELFVLANHAIQKNGGTIMGFELVNGRFERCENGLDYGSSNSMWVIKMQAART